MVPQPEAYICLKLQRKDEHGLRKWDLREMRMVGGRCQQQGMKLQVAADFRLEVDALTRSGLSEEGHETFGGVGQSQTNRCRDADPPEV